MSSTHWNIHSSWSKAGIGTSIVLELKKSPDNPSKKSSPRIAFDMGSTPIFDDGIPAKYVFISHGHIDHVGGLFSHARAHSVTCGGAAPTYFIPAQLLPQIEQCRDAMSLLDASNLHPEEEGGRTKSLINMKLVPVHPGDEIELKGLRFGSKTSFFMRAYEVDHAGHPALGYAIGSRTTTGLKKEYQNLDGKSIRDLVKSGVCIKEDPIEEIEIGYSGDTCANGLMGQSKNSDNVEGFEQQSKQKPSSFGIDQLFQAELLLCELTFLDSSDNKQQSCIAAERGHLHINDLKGIFSSHNLLEEENSDSNPCKSPRIIVFYHLSAKYQPAWRALDMIAAGLPTKIRDRCHVAISSMVTDDEKINNESLVKLIQSNGCISLSDYISQRDNV